MTSSDILVAKGTTDCTLLLRMANRHGLVAGATGTGKTVTLQTLAEGFSRAGVSVFMADVKGDLSGIAAAGGGNPKVEERLKMLKIKPSFEACPVQFWDVFGEQGTPVRTTISDMGAVLFARLLELNDVQEGVLTAIFKIADDEGLLLLDLKDLRSLCSHVSDNAKQYQSQYGNLAATSIAAIQRSLLTLESQGADKFFGEPALAVSDLMRTDGGKGVVNVLAADKLLLNPRMYATLLLWLLSELYEELPEAGDLDKPKLVFFFDEAHLLFTDAPKPLLQKVEQVVRLVRSKGVGVYFVTQSPSDVPDTVLAQLGNRVQHALRAYTPTDRKAVQVAAQSFRANPRIDTVTAITELGVGEALVSLLDTKGAPMIVERAFIVPPRSRVGPLTNAERQAQLKKSAMQKQYSVTVDRESAYEKLKDRATQASRATESSSTNGARQTKMTKPKASNRQSVGETLAKSAARAIGSSVGQALIRGILGSLKRR